MNEKVKDKIAKVYELVKRGVAGEQESAEKMLNKLLEKYNISENELNSINYEKKRMNTSNEPSPKDERRIITEY